MTPEELEALPGILIPCESIDALSDLVIELYREGIINDESFKLVNVPNVDEFLEGIF